ncbi:hypothetical protein MLD38_008757 [Melastoma candidum]|uniref:Uncharacterized protein n=1 Tax=Melastoma candidum TaxID=119954 RepID=A0ACB9RZP0_9MYRT|nr:hypothetical protein MLD38_008757 [Melastoma candidum]
MNETGRRRSLANILARDQCGPMRPSIESPGKEGSNGHFVKKEESTPIRVSSKSPNPSGRLAPLLSAFEQVKFPPVRHVAS